MIEVQELVYGVLALIVLGAIMAVTFKAIDQESFIELIKLVLVFMGGMGTSVIISKVKAEEQQTKQG